MTPSTTELPAPEVTADEIIQDRYLITVARTHYRQTTNDRAAAISMATGIAQWPEHRGLQVCVTDRQAPPRLTESIFGGTRVIDKPEVIWSWTCPQGARVRVTPKHIGN